MGNIISPYSMPATEHVMREIRIPTPEIPRFLKDDLEVNSELIPNFREAVGKAMTEALCCEETTPRVITDQLLKDWANMCYEVLTIMRHDMKLSLRRCFDILPGEFLEALQSGVRLEDLVEKSQKGMWWKKQKNGNPEEMVVDKNVDEDLTEEASKASLEELPHE